MKVEISKKVILGFLFTLFVCTEARAQLFIYPKEGQNQEQQMKDQQECSSWAVQQSGYNPAQASQMPVYEGAGAQRGSAVKGAAMGAARGALIAGVSDGDAGKGAAMGAGMGAIGGRMRSRYQQDQIAAAKNEVVRDMQIQGQTQYLRACKACLEGRGYTVS